MPVISVVSPVFNEIECLDELYRRLTTTLSQLCESHEIVLVDDGSSDDSWSKIAELSRIDSRVRGVRFSRNFGHHISISAGLDHAAGDWVVVMDSDLQDEPESIPELYAKALQGFDAVLACRSVRHDPWLRRLSSHAFYTVYAFLTDTTYDAQSGVFQILSRRVVDVLKCMRETNSFFPGLVDWVGFKRGRIFVQHAPRFAGHTKYPLRKQVSLAVNTILSFSDKPLLYVVYLGLLMAALSLVYGCYIIALALAGKVAVTGYASLASAIFFVGGFNIFTMGVVGMYVGRIFRQVQGRPIYVVAETSGVTADIEQQAVSPISAGCEVRQ